MDHFVIGVQLMSQLVSEMNQVRMVSVQDGREGGMSLSFSQFIMIMPD